MEVDRRASRARGFCEASSPMRCTSNTIPAALACASALVAFSGSAEEPAERPAGPLELPIPSAVADDPEAVELARLWVGQERLQVSLRAEALDQSGQWGAILAELARHIANSYARGQGADRTEVLDRIVLGFQMSVDHTSDDLTGRISP